MVGYINAMKIEEFEESYVPVASISVTGNDISTSGTATQMTATISPENASVKSVIGSNYCDIYLYLDLRTNYLTVISCIDNLIKGASGQAIQNMNHFFDFDEKAGLDLVPIL